MREFQVRGKSEESDGESIYSEYVILPVKDLPGHYLDLNTFTVDRAQANEWFRDMVGRKSYDYVRIVRVLPSNRVTEVVQWWEKK